MNIRNWPMDKIMQLPDFCFGSKWPASLYISAVPSGHHLAISTKGLPDRCVLWSITLNIQQFNGTFPCYADFALGDNLPVDEIEFMTLEPLIPYWGVLMAGRWGQVVVGHNFMHWPDFRYPVIAQGRRIVCHWQTSAVQGNLQATFMVSAFPTEVPDWLVSR